MAASDVHARREGRLGYWTLIAFYVFFGVLTWLMAKAEVTVKMDRLIYDTWVRLGQSAPSDEFVIVGIDAKSVKENGRWPWSRDDQATIIDNLNNAGARVILIDVLYPDFGIANPEGDARLAYSIERAGNVILPIVTEGKGADVADGERLPIPAIAQAASNLGHIFLPIDSDGIVRRVFLKAGFKTAHWSILSLVAMESEGNAPEQLPGVRTQHTDNATNWVGDYEVLIPFHGTKGTFTTIPAIDVLNDTFDRSIFEDSIVFFGLTATGLGDAVPTPILGLDQPIPGVEVHANIYSSLQSGTMVTHIGSVLAYVIVALAIALLLGIYSKLRPRWGILYTVLLALLPVAVSFFLYRFASIWFSPLLASIPILLAFPLWTWHRLEFATRFLRTETNKLAVYDDDLDVTSNLPLVGLFETAATHLDLRSWFVMSDGQLLASKSFSNQGSMDSAEIEKINTVDWNKRNGMQVKKYVSKKPLIVGYNFDNDNMNLRFGTYLDNTSRVQKLIELPEVGGTIEGLQNDADRLSKQSQRMLQLKVLNDNIFNGSPAGLIVWNAVGELLRHNELAVEMFDHTILSDATVRDFFISIGKDPVQIDKQAFDDIMLHGRNLQLNYVHGEDELVIDFNVLGDDLSERLIVASAVDLSDIRRAERLRSELIEYLSHDLKSPLISSLYLVSQEREDSLPEKDVAPLLQVESNINKTLKMIDDLLGLTRAENLSFEHLQPVFFENLIESTIDQLLPQARQKNITLTNKGIDDDVWVTADSSLLERAFVNVVGNAIKYSPEGTEVFISTHVKDNSWIITDIIDQGIGIPESRINKLFERFHRDPDVQEQFKGTGLGLALVATVIKQHGGTVVASSIENNGTTITLGLPIVEMEKSDDPQSPETIQIQQKPAENG